MTDIEVQILVEFDGNGQPTGNSFYLGSKYTGATVAEVGTLERIDGKTATRVLVVHRCIVQDNVTVLPPSGTFVVIDRASGKKKNAGPWTKT